MDETVITMVWLGEFVETSTAPIKVARVNDDASDTGAMPTNKFGQAMYDYISTMFNRAAYGRRSYCTVNNKRQLGCFGKFRDFGKRENIKLWITNCITVDSFSFRVN